ncbi:MAG: lipopolysaccharide heptosyltransferase II [Nitrospiraceae bacterium]|nr:MAG: lipopolysaccharide heptosyltransferase II [Nitrospiraceae bacterium]
MKILIIFFSGIGNFILFTPTLRAIRNKYPHAEITLLVKQKVVLDIIQEEGLIDNVVHYPQTNSPIKNILVQTSLMLTLRAKNYDLVITNFDAQGWKLSLLVMMTDGKINIGYKTGRWYDKCYDTLLTYDKRVHEVDRHLKIADSLGADITDNVPIISVKDEDREFAKTIISRDGSPLIGMHPGSSEYLWRKRWMSERFAALADRLSERYGAKILILGGKDEVKLSEKISILMHTAKPLILAGKTTIGQVAALIEQCTLFISNDSGLMHVAAAVRTPVVAIFGPTDPVKNSPCGVGHTIVRSGIPCSPCLTYDKDGCKSPECLEAVTVEGVVGVVENKLMSLGFVNK